MFFASIKRNFFLASPNLKWCENFDSIWAVVVAQLAELSFRTQEVCSSYPVNGEIL